MPSSCLFQGRSPGPPAALPTSRRAAALAVFRDDQERECWCVAVALAIVDLERQFEDLSLRHTAKYGFRTYDLLHVSSALLLGCDTFWSL